MRHVSMQVLGATTVLARLRRSFKEELALAGREWLRDLTVEETGRAYNEAPRGRVLLVNARVNPFSADLAKLSRKTDFATTDSSGDVVAMSIPAGDYEKVLSPEGTIGQKRLASLPARGEKTASKRPLLFRYPWDLIPENERAIAREYARPRMRTGISKDAEVEEYVKFDTRGGPVIVGPRARIEAFSRISGPCFIGAGSVIHSGLVRSGTTIGENCRVGGEVDSSIIYPFTNKAHAGFLGHSIVGEWVNLGARSVTSDLKNTYGTVKVKRGGKRVDSGLVKLGAIIGDMAKVSIGTMIYSGKTVGLSAHCSGIVGEDVPDFQFAQFGGRGGTSGYRLTLSSVLATQSRMMVRRGEKFTSARRRLIERIYERGAEGR